MSSICDSNITHAKSGDVAVSQMGDSDIFRWCTAREAFERSRTNRLHLLESVHGLEYLFDFYKVHTLKPYTTSHPSFFDVERAVQEARVAVKRHDAVKQQLRFLVCDKEKDILHQYAFLEKRCFPLPHPLRVFKVYCIVSSKNVA